MPELSAEQCNFLERLREGFWNRFREEVVTPLELEMRPVWIAPGDIKTFLDELATISPLLVNGINAEGIALDDQYIDSIKSFVLSERRRIATELDERRQLTTDPDLLANIDAQLAEFDWVMNAEWFRAAPTRRIPRLSDFLNLSRAETILRARHGLAVDERISDEKFQILLAPTLILPDMEYYRRTCELRDKPVSLAYLDIDDFKDFNSRYTEQTVDRDLLPHFMRAIEAHMYARGSAYRKGGDEYVVLLPNASHREALALLSDLRQNVANLDYRGIEEHTTVSVGLCTLDPDSFLTNREAEDHANRAKKYAKVQGKNRIAAYRGSLFRDGDLYIADPASED